MSSWSDTSALTVGHWEEMITSVLLTLPIVAGNSILRAKWGKESQGPSILDLLCLASNFCPMRGAKWRKAAPYLSASLVWGRPSATQSWGWWEILVACPSQKYCCSLGAGREGALLSWLYQIELCYAELEMRKKWILLWIPQTIIVLNKV